MSFPPISDLVPHGLPMRALEELVEWEPGRATCRMTVRKVTPFVTRESVPCCATIEFMGQAIAACLGYEAYRGGNNVRVGMIVGVRTMEMMRPSLEVGEVLTITVTRLRGDEDVSVFRGEVVAADGVVSRAQLTLVHPEKPPE